MLASIRTINTTNPIHIVDLVVYHKSHFVSVSFTPRCVINVKETHHQIQQRENPKTREGKNKKQQEKKREDRGSMPSTKSNKNKQRENPKTREGKNKKQQEKEREDRGSIHQIQQKQTKSLLINLCFLKNPCFPGRRYGLILEIFILNNVQKIWLDFRT